MTSHNGTTRAHFIMQKLRDLRRQAGLSLEAFEAKYGIPAVVVGSYERGDRQPSLHRADEVLAAFGRKVIDVPMDFDPTNPGVLTAQEMAAYLRRIADQLEQAFGVNVPASTEKIAA